MRGWYIASRPIQVLVVLCTTLVSLPSSAAQQVLNRPAKRPTAWSVRVDGGVALPLPSNHRTHRTTVGFAISRVCWSHLDLDIAGRLGISDIATDVVASSRAGLRLTVGDLAFSVGLRVGYASLRIDKEKLGTLWTNALFLNPGLVLDVGLWRHLEIRLAALGVSLYWNQVWMVAWEPSAGIGVRF